MPPCLRDLPAATQTRHVDGATRSFLAPLPTVRRIATAWGDLLLCHGTGEDDMHAVQSDDSAYALEANEELQRALRDPDMRIVISCHSDRRRRGLRPGRVRFVDGSIG